MLNSFQVNKKTPEQDEKDVGFTVIRVESSVSTEDAEDNKVNADNDAVEEANAAVTLGDNNENENSEEKEEEAHKEETTSEAPEVSTTSLVCHTAPPQSLPGFRFICVSGIM